MAKSRTYKTEAIVLKRKNFSEADKILTLFTKHYGKISAIAKGIRKLTSRKAASLELFNNLNLFLARGKNLDIITETTLISSFPHFRKDLSKVRLAYEACEVVEKLTVEEKGNMPIFLKLKDFLYKIDRKDRPCIPARTVLADFKAQILDLLGFGTPKNPTNENIDSYIENIIERKLTANKVLQENRISG